MKYASSIRYGGQLIEAADCDYDSYKDLGLLCPECKDPVFLRANTTQLRHGKEVLIHSHFAHFPGKDPALVLACENRVKQYDAKELEKRAAESRGQRRKLFNRYFYKIMSKELGFNESNVRRAKSDSDIFNVVKEMARIFSTKESKDEITENFLDVFYAYKEGKHFDKRIVVGIKMPDGRIAVSTKLQKNFEQRILNGYDLKMHVLVATEALEFITTNGAKPILWNLFCHSFSSFFFAVKDGYISSRFLTSSINTVMIENCACGVMTYLMFTPWVTALGEAAKSQSTPATPRSPLPVSSLASLPS